MKGKEQNHIIWKNIEFDKFQRFVLASILRTHLSMKKNGERLLIDKHFIRIREIYKSGSIVDDVSYPIIMTKLIDSDGFKNVVTFPFVNKIDNHHVVEFSGGGYTFWVFVSSHKKRDGFYRASLKQDGSMYLLHAAMRDNGAFKNAFPTLVKLANEYPMNQ